MIDDVNGVLVLLIFGLSFLIHSFLKLQIQYKAIIIQVVLPPLSFFIEVPFPTGIARIHVEHVPHAWCANGCASVCRSACDE